MTTIGKFDGSVPRGLIPLSEVALQTGTFSSDVANLVDRLRVPAGGRVVVACRDSRALAVGVFAALHSGCQAVLPANLQYGHIDDLAASCNATVFDGEMPPVANAFPAVVSSNTETASLLKPLDMNQSKIVLYTSGTTGAPLAVVKPLRCFEAEVRSLESIFPGVMRGAVIATVPAHHIYGFLFRVLWPLASHGSSWPETVNFPEEVVAQAIESPGVTLVSSPAFLHRAVAVLNFDVLHSLLGTVFSSGGPLAPEIASAYNAGLKHPIREIYGSTETGGIAYRVACDNKDSSPLWMPLPNVQLRIDHDGVLSVRSPFLESDRWFETSDTASSMSETGFILRGRRDRIVKLQEQRISLVDIESRLSASPLVAEVRVQPLPVSVGKRESLCAVVVPTSMGWSDLRQIGKRGVIQQLGDLLHPFIQTSGMPRRWRFVRALPLNDRGKVTTENLLALFATNGRRITQARVIESRIDQGAVTLRLVPPKELFYFEGHFDAAPILPGVVQVGWALEQAREQFDLPSAVCRIEALKFFDVITAEQEITLLLRYQTDDAKLSFQYSRDGQLCASGRIIFGV